MSEGGKKGWERGVGSLDRFLEEGGMYFEVELGWMF